jgi:hypothetical protein
MGDACQLFTLLPLHAETISMDGQKGFSGAISKISTMSWIIKIRVL